MESNEVHRLEFFDGDAVEFSKLLKSMKDETGFNFNIRQVEGSHPNLHNKLVVFVSTPEFYGSTEDLYKMVSNYTPLDKKKKG